MKRHICLFINLFFFFAMFTFFLDYNCVLAAVPEATDINDGYTGWRNSDDIKRAFKAYSNDYAIGYTFGRLGDGKGFRLDPHNNINMGSTIGSLNPNVFLKDKDGHMVRAYYNNVPTSLGFGLYSRKGEVVGLLKNSLSSVSNGRLGRYFETTNEEGDVIMKIMNFYKNDPQLEYEMLLSPSEAGAVELSAYVKNTSNTKKNYGIVFGADTLLDGNNSMHINPDKVPIRSLGNNSGLYISNDDYRLNTYIDVPYGPSGYNTSGGYGVLGGNWMSGLSDGVGQNVSNDSVDRILLNGIDSAYSLTWPFKTDVKPGQVDRYSFIQGMQVASFATPRVKLSYKNDSRQDTENRVGDKLQFKVALSNTGLKSEWSNINLSNVLGQEASDLLVDPNSIKVTYNGDEPSSQSGVYNQEDGTLKLGLNKSLLDNQRCTVTFDATIQNSASGKTLKVTSTADGKNNKASGTPPLSAHNSVDIPVQKSLVFTFTNQVRNASSTPPGGSFSNTTTAQVGDVIDYKLNYSVGLLSLLSPGGRLEGDLPTGLSLSGPVKLTYSTGLTKTFTSLSNLPIEQMYPGSNVTIEFKAIANGNASITDTESLSYSPKIKFPVLILPIGEITADTSTVNIQKQASLDYVPDNIDFGMVTPWGNLNKRKNISTTRNGSSENTCAIKNYRAGSDIQVSYDNDGENAMKNGNNKLEATDDDGILLYLNQQQIDGTKKLVPITTTGTSLNKKALNGRNIDLTEYVGKNQFELRAKNKNLKEGTYSGKITWNLVDSLSN